MTTIQPDGYDPVAKSLHWLTVALLCVQFSIAWSMPHIGRNTPNVGLVNLHLSVGALTLLLVLARLIWRWRHPAPPAPAHVSPWQALAARATHALLYTLLIVLPLAGWANASYRGYDVSLFGLVPLPALVAKGTPFARGLGDIHVDMAYVLLGFVGLHVAAALYHRLVLHDEVLQRMLPAPRDDGGRAA